MNKECNNISNWIKNSTFFKSDSWFEFVYCMLLLIFALLCAAFGWSVVIAAACAATLYFIGILNLIPILLTIFLLGVFGFEIGGGIILLLVYFIHEL